MKRLVKGLIAVLLFGVLVMPVLVFAEKPQTALGAQDPITYIDENGAEKAISTYTEVSSSTTLMVGAGLKSWYVVKGKVSISDLIKVIGDVHLILCDGATLTAKKGINVEAVGILSIYAQSAENKGKLVAKGGEEQAGIGGGNNEDAGTISIYGGTIEATGGEYGAGIGGGDVGDGGKITIAGGAITATGGTFGAGIGGGDKGDGGTITIAGGVVTATGGKYGAGIGGGNNNDGGTITIAGGTITATGGIGAAGIGGGNWDDGGTINITGGTINLAQGTNGTDDSGGGAGIGGGGGKWNTDYGNGGTIKISGGTIVSAQGAKSGAGIGGGDFSSGGEIRITGGTIKKTAGGKNGAGIGGGYQGSGGTITISGGTIDKAYGGNSGAGIGGGYQGNGGTITISGGEFDKVYGGNGEGSNKNTSTGGAGIGGGGSAKSSTITIKGNAHIKEILSGYNGAGIGGGYNGSGETIVFEGNPVIDSVKGSCYGAGIGSGGYSKTSGSITIKGGTIKATSDYYAAAIGGGLNSDCGEIRISDGTIYAYGPAGIGSGGSTEKGNASGDIQISGGSVTAKANASTSGSGGAAIGGGDGKGAKKITISGGFVNAFSSNNGAAIGGGRLGDSGEITISGGTIYASAKKGGAGIGAGSDGSGEKITINGGEITAINDETGAGIGGGKGHSGGTITITGGTITKALSKSGGAGIGGGSHGEGGTIRILGGTIKMAICIDTNGAGIGGGAGEDGGDILITGNANVYAVGGKQGAGIGGGGADDDNSIGGSCGSVTIKALGTQKPQVFAAGGYCAAGIGSGMYGTGGTINIKGGTVTAEGGKHAAGIGGALVKHGVSGSGCGGNITISGGTVTAYGCFGGAGIGGGDGYKNDSYGYGGAGGNITISGGEVNAEIKMIDYSPSVGYYAGAAIGGGSRASSGIIQITGGKVTAAIQDPDSPDIPFVVIGNGLNYDGSSIGSEGLFLGYTDDTKAGMSVTAFNYNCKVVVLPGKSFTDGYCTEGKLNTYSGTLTEEAKKTIAGRTIVPNDETTSISGATYLDLDGETKGPVHCEVVTKQTTGLKGNNSTAGWYMVTGSVTPFTLSKTLSVSGQVNLILCDGAELNGLISLNNGSLTVWAQSTGEMMGKLTADASAGAVSLTGSNGISGSGNLIINGGAVSANGKSSRGINLKGNMTVNGGKVSAIGSSEAGICLSSETGDVTLSVTGGLLTAKGDGYNNPGLRLESSSGGTTASFSGGTTELSGALNAFVYSTPKFNHVNYYNMAVYRSKTSGAVPVLTDERGYALLRERYVKITPCGTDACPHSFDRTAGKCKYCNTEYGNKVTMLVNPVGKGTIKAKVGKEETVYDKPFYAREGEAIRLSIDVSSDSDLKVINVESDSGESVEVGEDFSFTMPAEPVKVKAELATPKSITKDITPSDKSGGDVKVWVNGKESNQAVEGATVRLEVNPESGYGLKTLTVRKTKTFGLQGLIQVRNNCFTMPDYPVTVEAELVDETHEVRTEIVPAESDNKVTAMIAGKTVTKAAQDATVDLVVEPAEEYELESISLTPDGGEAQTLTENSFTMPGTNVTIKGVFRKVFAINRVVTPEEISNDGIVITSPENADKAAESETVAFEVNKELTSGYELGTVSVTKQSGGDVEVSQNDTGFTFPMPGEPVTIAASFNKIYKIEKALMPEGGSGGDVTMKPNGKEGDEAIKGTPVTLEVSTKEGYLLDTLTVTKADGKTVELNAGNQFTMPDEDVTVSAKFITEWEALQNAISNAEAEAVIDVSRFAGKDGRITALSDEEALSVPNNAVITLDLKGCTIDRGLSEKAAIDGGNVLTVAGDLTVVDTGSGESGTITGGNNTNEGGGVILRYGSTFDLRGGCITGNSTASCAGGILVNRTAVFRASGNANVTENTRVTDEASIADNVYLSDETFVTLPEGETFEGLAIGVTTETAPTKKEAVLFTSGLPGEDALTHFTSDVEGYELFLDSTSGEGVIGYLPAIPPTITGITGLTGEKALTVGYTTGGSINVSALAAEGHTITGYQWYTCDGNGKAMEEIDDATEADYPIPTGLAAGNYYFRCIVTAERDENGTTATAVSDVAQVTVKEAQSPDNPDNPVKPVKKGYTTLAKITTSGKKAAVLAWDDVAGAEGYDVFYAKCAKGSKYKKIASVKSSTRKYKIKGLKKGTCYKAVVKAWKKTNGKKVYIGKSSPSVHLIAGGYNIKECNAKSIKLNKKSLKLAKGKKATLKAKVKLVKRGRKLLKHVKAVRWFSSNTNVAKVNSKGKVTAVGSGTCTIYAIVHSGKKAAAKITVK